MPYQDLDALLAAQVPDYSRPPWPLRALPTTRRCPECFVLSRFFNVLLVAHHSFGDSAYLLDALLASRCPPGCSKPGRRHLLEWTAVTCHQLHLTIAALAVHVGMRFTRCAWYYVRDVCLRMGVIFTVFSSCLMFWLGRNSHLWKRPNAYIQTYITMVYDMAKSLDWWLCFRCCDVPKLSSLFWLLQSWEQCGDSWKVSCLFSWRTWRLPRTCSVRQHRSEVELACWRVERDPSSTNPTSCLPVTPRFAGFDV